MELLRRTFRWVAVSTVGALLMAVGVVLLFLPGPGLLLIVAGLAVLSLEFLWAERLRDRAMERVRSARAARRRQPPATIEPAGDDRHDDPRGRPDGRESDAA